MSVKTEISSFDDLLHAARIHRQRQPSVFAGSEPPEGRALVQESRRFEPPGQPWHLVFTAALSGTPGAAPSDNDADLVLRRMGEAVKTGACSAHLPFNREGRPVRLG